MKILMLGGPPKSGKDEGCKYIYNKERDTTVFERFSAPLKTSFAAIANLEYNEYFEVEKYEAIKDEPIDWLNNYTYRQYQINLSERHFKPLYGNDIFAKLFVERLKRYRKDDLIVVPDSGFKIEVDYLEQSDIPLEDILLLRIHRDGCDFSNDSREYVYPDKITSFDVTNNGSLEVYHEKVTLFKDLFMRNSLDEARHFSFLEYKN